jgi:hypothetical protein
MDKTSKAGELNAGIRVYAALSSSLPTRQTRRDSLSYSATTSRLRQPSMTTVGITRCSSGNRGQTPASWADSIHG